MCPRAAQALLQLPSLAAHLPGADKVPPRAAGCAEGEIRRGEPGPGVGPLPGLRDDKCFYSGSRGGRKQGNITIKEEKKREKMDCHSLNKIGERGVRNIQSCLGIGLKGAGK